MNKQSRPINSRENEKSLYINPNTRVPAQLVVNTGTRENNSDIKNAQTYQNFITAKNPDKSRHMVGINQGSKILGTTRTKITRKIKLSQN